MGIAIIIVASVATILVVGIWRLALLRRAASDQRHRRRWTAALVATALVALLVVVTVVSFVVGGPDYTKPVPEFPSVAAYPDAGRHGTVAYVVVSKDVLCWSFDPAAPITVAWIDATHLLVTRFITPPGTHALDPNWAKTVDVSSGSALDVPASELGKGAIPPSGPTKNAAGETVTAAGKDGSLTLTVRGPSGTQMLLAVRDSNPGWSIRSGPAWSPDGAWILWSDGGRLLLTTPGDMPTTHVLSTGDVFGVVADYNIPIFAINGADLPLS